MVGVHPGVGVILGPLFCGSTLGGHISKHRNCQHGRGDSSSKFRHIVQVLVDLLATGRTGAMFFARVPELPVLTLIGR